MTSGYLAVRQVFQIFRRVIKRNEPFIRTFTCPFAIIKGRICISPVIVANVCLKTFLIFTFAVAICNLSTSLSIGNSSAGASADFHLSQSELDQIAVANGSNALTFDFDRIVVGDGDFSDFDLTLIATESVEFYGDSSYASLVVGGTSLEQVSLNAPILALEF